MHRLKSILFPKENRKLKFKRWVKIIIRTLHLIGFFGISGKFIYHSANHEWQFWWGLTMLSGVLFVGLEIWSNGIWLIQLRGLAITLKLFFILLIYFFPDYSVFLLITVIIISGIISHAPGDIRYYSLFHKKRLDTLNDAKRIF